MQDLYGRFVTVTFNEGWVKVIAKKTGRARKVWLSSDPEWTRRQLAWLLMLSPNVKPSDVNPQSAAYATRQMSNIIEESISRAHAEMGRVYGWGNPISLENYGDLDEDWVNEYYKRYGVFKRKIQNAIVKDQAACAAGR